MITTLHVTSGLTAVIGGVVGSQALPYFMANIPLDGWIKELQGPAGALIGLSIGLWWMKGRLDKAEAKADKREEERDEDRKNLITVVAQNSIIMNRNSDVLQEVTEALKSKKE